MTQTDLYQQKLAKYKASLTEQPVPIKQTAVAPEPTRIRRSIVSQISRKGKTFDVLECGHEKLRGPQYMAYRTRRCWICETFAREGLPIGQKTGAAA